MRKHIESIPDTVREMHGAEPIREIPVTVLTPGNAAPLSDEHLERIGDRVRQVVAPRASTGFISTSPALSSNPFATWWPPLRPRLSPSQDSRGSIRST